MLFLLTYRSEIGLVLYGWEDDVHIAVETN